MDDLSGLVFETFEARFNANLEGCAGRVVEMRRANATLWL